MGELDHKIGWAPKNWYFWIMLLKKIPESPLDCKEIKPVNPKGKQLWIFIGRIDVKTEAPIHWLPNAKSWLIGKGPDARKIEGKRRKGRQKMRWLDRIIDYTNVSKLWEIVKDREAWHAAVHGVAKSWTQQLNNSKQMIVQEAMSVRGGGGGERGSSLYFPLNFALNPKLF